MQLAKSDRSHGIEVAGQVVVVVAVHHATILRHVVRHLIQMIDALLAMNADIIPTTAHALEVVDTVAARGQFPDLVHVIENEATLVVPAGLHLLVVVDALEVVHHVDAVAADPIELKHGCKREELGFVAA